MTKKKAFAVGDRVGYAVVEEEEYEYGPTKLVPIHINEYMEEPDYGVITDVLSTGEVLVKWDPNCYMDSKEPVPVGHLMLEQDLKDKLVTLDKEFKEVTKQIKAKMKEAAALVKESGKLAKKTGNKLADMYDAVNPLIGAMDASGWRSSSWGC